MSATREEFWKAKIENNRRRDTRVIAALLEADWRVLILWECAIRGPGRLPAKEALERSAEFITISSRQLQEISGRFTSIS
jgi:DNA mismatch endonuclease, patch repair protein